MFGKKDTNSLVLACKCILCYSWDISFPNVIYNTYIVHLDTAVRSSVFGNLFAFYYKAYFYKADKSKNY